MLQADQNSTDQKEDLLHSASESEVNLSREGSDTKMIGCVAPIVVARETTTGRATRTTGPHTARDPDTKKPGHSTPMHVHGLHVVFCTQFMWSMRSRTMSIHEMNKKTNV